jgi:hypothetical protein
VQEGITPGKLDIEKLKTLGLKPGPECAKLKQGLNITLPNGTIVSFLVSPLQHLILITLDLNAT